MKKYRKIRKESIKKVLLSDVYCIGVSVMLNGVNLQEFRADCLKKGLEFQMIERNYIKYIVDEYGLFLGNTYIISLDKNNLKMDTFNFIEKFFDIYYVVIEKKVYSYSYIKKLLDKRGNVTSIELEKVMFLKNNVLSKVLFMNSLNIKNIQKINLIKKNG